MRVSSRALPAIGAVLSALILAACGGGSTGSSAGGSTAQSASVVPHLVTLSQNEKMMYVPAADSLESPPAGAPPIVNAWVSLSAIVNGMPCVNCAGNPPVAGSLGVAFSQPYLPHTGGYELTYTFYNVSEGRNSCSLIFNFLQGTTSLLHNVSTITLNGNGQYVYFIGGPLPSTAVVGPGVVNANVHCHGFVPAPATQKVYLH